MITPDSAAEIQKLAHQLGVEPTRLAGLTGVPAGDLRILRAQIGDALFEADKPRFAKMAALSKAVPVAVAAKLTEFAMPPLLAARTAELIEPRRAADLVGRLSDGYLADVSAAMDASRAAEVVAEIPADRIATIGAELARRAEWVVIGGFVAQSAHRHSPRRCRCSTANSCYGSASSWTTRTASTTCRNW